MIREDLHIHSCFCDGKDSPEDIVLSAIAKGMTKVGILTHSYTSFDQNYCIKREEIPVFIDEISRLKEKYRDRIEILCGVEQDIYSGFPTSGFDYVIGSQHYLLLEGCYYPIDNSEKSFIRLVSDLFDGDYYEMAKTYFRMEKEAADRTGADIIGHFDLLTKFNENDRLFDTGDERYTSYWKDAADHLLKYDIPFEINTGAISRGYRSQPYPQKSIISYIREKNGRLILSSDSHQKETVGYKFDEFEYLISQEGII